MTRSVVCSYPRELAHVLIWILRGGSSARFQSVLCWYVQFGSFFALSLQFFYMFVVFLNSHHCVHLFAEFSPHSSWLRCVPRVLRIVCPPQLSADCCHPGCVLSVPLFSEHKDKKGHVLFGF